MKTKKHLVLMPLMLSLLLVGCSNSLTGNGNYVVTLGENDYCEVYKIDQTYSPTRYDAGWKFTQHSSTHFSLQKDNTKNVYSNSRYGYYISIK